MESFIKLVVIIGFSFLFVNQVQAAGFNLKSIDGVNTDGKLYSQWYHTSLQPTLSGEAPAGSTVTINIDGTDYTTTATDSGTWTWTPPQALTSGDHSVTLTNNDSSLSFTLTLGEENVDWDVVGTGNGETLPTVGIAFPTIALLISGIGISGYFFKNFVTNY